MGGGTCDESFVTTVAMSSTAKALDVDFHSVSSEPDVGPAWEWVGKPTHRKNGLNYYASCQRVYNDSTTRPQVFSIGDIICCATDEEGDLPWLAQIIEFCLDPSLASEPSERVSNVDLDDSESETEDWLAKRVSLRWMYRLSDVTEECGRKVSGYKDEVFLSDHVTGPEVNSVNIISGSAILSDDRTYVDENPKIRGKPVYFCKRFYRHAEAIPVSKRIESPYQRSKPKTWRTLEDGELADVLKNPTMSMYMFYRHRSLPPKRRPDVRRRPRSTGGVVANAQQRGNQDRTRGLELQRSLPNGTKVTVHCSVSDSERGDGVGPVVSALDSPLSSRDDVPLSQYGAEDSPHAAKASPTLAATLARQSGANGSLGNGSAAVGSSSHPVSKGSISRKRRRITSSTSDEDMPLANGAAAPGKVMSDSQASAYNSNADASMPTSSNQARVPSFPGSHAEADGSARQRHHQMQQMFDSSGSAGASRNLAAASADGVPDTADHGQLAGPANESRALPDHTDGNGAAHSALSSKAVAVGNGVLGSVVSADSAIGNNAADQHHAKPSNKGDGAQSPLTQAGSLTAKQMSPGTPQGATPKPSASASPATPEALGARLDGSAPAAMPEPVRTWSGIEDVDEVAAEYVSKIAKDANAIKNATSDEPATPEPSASAKDAVEKINAAFDELTMKERIRCKALLPQMMELMRQEAASHEGQVTDQLLAQITVDVLDAMRKLSTK